MRIIKNLEQVEYNPYVLNKSEYETDIPFARSNYKLAKPKRYCSIYYPKENRFYWKQVDVARILVNLSRVKNKCVDSKKMLLLWIV
jgi:hypothetical protein